MSLTLSKLQTFVRLRNQQRNRRSGRVGGVIRHVAHRLNLDSSSA